MLPLDYGARLYIYTGNVGVRVGYNNLLQLSITCTYMILAVKDYRNVGEKVNIRFHILIL